MPYPLPPYNRPPRRKTEPVANPAGLAAMASEFADKPFGSYGEMLPSPPAEPPPPAPEPFVIPPPPWQEQLERGDFDPALLAPPEAPADQVDALSAMKAASGDGYDPPAWRPIVPPTPPLLPVKIPPPDWREEELERARRERENQHNPEPIKSLQSRPA